MNVKKISRTEQPAADYMRESKVFNGFSTEECLLLEKILKPGVKSYFKDEVICREGEAKLFIGIILKGMVSGAKFYRDGKSHLVHTFGAKEIIGLEAAFSSKGGSPITYMAAKDTELLLFRSISAENSEQIPPVLHLKLKDNIIQILADENIKSIYKLEVLSKRALRSRIMTFFQILSKKVGAKTFRIGMDREQFAQYLCVNRSALSYELSQMQKEGLIQFEKDRFTIL